LNEAKLSQTVFNSFTITSKCHWEFNLLLHATMREFNLSHMPNLLDTNRTK